MTPTSCPLPPLYFSSFSWSKTQNDSFQFERLPPIHPLRLQLSHQWVSRIKKVLILLIHLVDGNGFLTTLRYENLILITFYEIIRMWKED